MMDNQNIIHIFGVLTYCFYFLFTLLQFFKFKKAFYSFLNIGIISNLIFLFACFKTEIGQAEGSILFESHPALILLMSSFVFFLSLLFYRKGRAIIVKWFSLTALLFGISGSILLHKVGVGQVYELSPLLIIHILISLVSQVFLVLLIVTSILLFSVDRKLKLKGKVEDLSQYPALIPTEKFWLRIAKMSILFLLGSIVTGFIQLGSINFPTKIIFAFLNFIALVFILLVYRNSKLSIGKISFFSAISLMLLMAFQILIRAKLFIF